MHCGLCLPTCPTYDATHVERNSPRGRISLMRAIASAVNGTGFQPFCAQTCRAKCSINGPVFAKEMYFCLGCLACSTACPAGVNYAELFEAARAEAESTGALDSTSRSWVRAVTLGWLFMDLERLRLLGLLIRLWQDTGAQSLFRLDCGSLSR